MIYAIIFPLIFGPIYNQNTPPKLVEFQSIDRVRASYLSVLNAAFEDFASYDLPLRCYTAFITQDYRSIYVMFISLKDSVDTQRDDSCGPGVRYTYDLDGNLESKVWIR